MRMEVFFKGGYSIACGLFARESTARHVAEIEFNMLNGDVFYRDRLDSAWRRVPASEVEKARWS